MKLTKKENVFCILLAVCVLELRKGHTFEAGITFIAAWESIDGNNQERYNLQLELASAVRSAQAYILDHA